jgi:hypothetical protein
MAMLEGTADRSAWLGTYRNIGRLRLASNEASAAKGCVDVVLWGPSTTGLPTPWCADALNPCA